MDCYSAQIHFILAFMQDLSEAQKSFFFITITLHSLINYEPANVCIEYYVYIISGACSLLIQCDSNFVYLAFDFDCLAASNWPPGHPRSDHHVSNPHRPDYY